MTLIFAHALLAKAVALHAAAAIATIRAIRAARQPPTETTTMDHDAIARTIDSIARTHFHQLRRRKNPLQVQNNDAQDFIDAAVWAIRDALEEAHMCGWADAERHHKVGEHAA